MAMGDREEVVTIFQGEGMTVEDEFEEEEDLIELDEEENVISIIRIQSEGNIKDYKVEGESSGVEWNYDDETDQETDQYYERVSSDNNHKITDIKIEESKYMSKPTVSGLAGVVSHPGGISLSGGVSLSGVVGPSNKLGNKQVSRTSVFLCPDSNCKLRLPSRPSLLTHVQLCHRDGPDTDKGLGHFTFQESLEEAVEDFDQMEDEEEIENYHVEAEFKTDSNTEATVLKKLRKPRGSPDKNTPTKILECHYCGLKTGAVASELRRHIKEVHENPKQYKCTECGIEVSRKYHLIRHIKAVHHKEKFWKCEDCDYQTNNQVCYKKHKRNKHEQGGDCENIYSLDHNLTNIVDESELRCVCTWCPFKSNKYSVVKKHIEIHHERKKQYQCKECVFIGQSVDDYAEHYHTFHKTDEYRHACTDCNFKCTNKQELKVHYNDTHCKQRLYVCKMCDHKSSDLNNMKRHINNVHSNDIEEDDQVYQCQDCDFVTEDSLQYQEHQYSYHGINMETVETLETVETVEEPDMKIVITDNGTVVPWRS